MDLNLTHKTGSLVRVDLPPEDQRPKFSNPEDAIDIATEMLGRVDETLGRLGVDYFLADGTLLGATRQNGFIPGDNDLDIKLPRISLTPPVIEALARAGLTQFRKTYFEDRLTNTAFHFRGVILDVCGFLPLDQKIRFFSCFWKPNRRFYNGYLIYEAPFDGRERTQFLGVDTWRPRNIETYLEGCYGPGWRQPVTEWDHFFSFPGLVGITGEPDMLVRGTRRWLKARGAPATARKPNPATPAP